MPQYLMTFTVGVYDIDQAERQNRRAELLAELEALDEKP